MDTIVFYCMLFQHCGSFVNIILMEFKATI